MLVSDQIEQGPLLGASREELLPYLEAMPLASGRRVLVRDFDSGYGAYLFSFVAKKVVCLVSSENLTRNRQFFKAPNLKFVDKMVTGESFEMTFRPRRDK
jgi:hypothetical protein